MRKKLRKTILAYTCIGSLLCVPSAEALELSSNLHSSNAILYAQSLTSSRIDPDAVAMLSQQVAEILMTKDDGEIEVDTSDKSEKLTADEIEKMSIEELEAEIVLQQEIMDNAHDMAESARLLGLSSESGTIQTASTFYNEAKDSVNLLKTALNTKKANITPVFTYEIYTKSNLSPSDYEVILKDTPLEGHGQDFYDMEQKWGVNGLFALSVAQGESSMGANGIMATKRNNFFGIQNHSFSTAKEGILFFGELLSDPLYKGKDIDKVAAIYCPPTSQEWASQKKIIMRSFWQKIESPSVNA